MRARLEYRVALLAFAIHLHGTPLRHTLQSEVLHTQAGTRGTTSGRVLYERTEKLDLAAQLCASSNNQ